MTSSKMLHIRIDDYTKTQATEALESMGLTVSEGVRLFLHRVAADQALPFDIKVPNARTRAAMAEADEIIRSRGARFDSSSEVVSDLEKDVE